MTTQLVDDRQLQVEEILSAFDLPLGGTISGVAYGGAFIPDATGAAIETRDHSTGNILARVRTPGEVECSGAIAAPHQACMSGRLLPAPTRGEVGRCLG